MLSMTVGAPQYRLVLVRHAKSAYPYGVPDHDRPLAGKGRRTAQAVGAWFVGEGPRPDLVICSDAQRARHTWEIVSAGILDPPPVRLEPRLYGATSAEVIELARACAAAVHTLVMVGHEPTLSSATLLLAGAGSDPTSLARVSAKFPTGAIAVLRLASGWRDLALGGAVLETFAVPRA